MLSMPAAHTILAVPVCTLDWTHTASISKVNRVSLLQK